MQRTEAGTVFSYLPIKVGDRVDDEKAAQAVKALFATGFFRDVRLEEENGVLLVVVQERPTISKIDISGNKEFDTETLKKALKEIGLAEARIFDRSALDRAEQEIKRQYISRGRYAAKVTVTVTPQERNRVAVEHHGRGGRAVEDRAHQHRGRQRVPGARAARADATHDAGLDDLVHEKRSILEAEAVRRPRNAAQLLSEPRLPGVQRRFDAGVDHAGQGRHLHHDQRDRGTALHGVRRPARRATCRWPDSSFRAMVQIRPGDVFSRERLQASAKAISDRLGTEGYAFANVNAVPEIDRAKRTAAFTFYIDPGRRVYIRKINISGNVRTRDEVIRREMRQLESAWYDAARIDRSKVRIRRLGYFDDVNIETPPVPGVTDEADVDVTVTERSTGQLLAGLGYSSADGFVFNASVSQQNIFGSGNALVAAINTSQVNRVISATFAEPYWTTDGVSRLLELYQRNTDASSLSVSQYASSTAGGAIAFGVPISETDSINLGLRYEHTSIDPDSDSPAQIIAYVARVRKRDRQLRRQRRLVA